VGAWVAHRGWAQQPPIGGNVLRLFALRLPVLVTLVLVTVANGGWKWTGPS
jgi:hypothetical protein